MQKNAMFVVPSADRCYASTLEKVAKENVTQIVTLEKNAALLGDHGAALVLGEEGLDGKKLFAAAAGLLKDDARMAKMADSMAQLGIRDATERIYRTVMALVK